MQAWISCSFDSNALVMFMLSILAYITLGLWTWGVGKIKLLSILGENFLVFSKAPNTTRLLHGNIKRACIHNNILNFSCFGKWLTVYGAFKTNNSQMLFQMADFFCLISPSCCLVTYAWNICVFNIKSSTVASRFFPHGLLSLKPNSAWKEECLFRQRLWESLRILELFKSL